MRIHSSGRIEEESEVGLQQGQFTMLDVYMYNKLTPTTKSDLHDELISAEEVVKQGLMSQQVLPSKHPPVMY